MCSTMIPGLTFPFIDLIVRDGETMHVTDLIRNSDDGDVHRHIGSIMVALRFQYTKRKPP